MGRPGPKKAQEYGVEFKRAAVQFSHRPGIQVKAVADALDIHPFMLSRWRKEFREGRLRSRGHRPEPGARKPPRESEIKRLQELERLCRPYRVTRAGYYAWRQRPESARRGQDRFFLEAMETIFHGSGGTYGDLGERRDLHRRRQPVVVSRRCPGPVLATGAGLETRIGAELAAQQRMTRGGAPDENAHMESFFHSLKADVIHGRRFEHVTDLRRKLHRYIDYYNRKRPHPALQYQSPVDYERGAA